jgi:hypothetical protein
MPAASFVATTPRHASTASAIGGIVSRPTRFVRSRSIESEKLYHNQKPFAQMVAGAFDGPVLRLSERMKLLEEADNRHIRRGDAIDLIEFTRRELQAKHAVRPHGRLHTFMTRYAIFVACYVMFGLIWCVVLSR